MIDVSCKPARVFVLPEKLDRMLYDRCNNCQYIYFKKICNNKNMQEVTPCI